MAADLDSAKYVSFVTYKKDGTPVAAPVWVVPFEGGYAFTTDPDSFKIKRLRNNARGKVAPGAVVHSGAAVVLDKDASEKVAHLIRKKYVIGTKLLGVYSLVKKIKGSGSTAGDAAIKVTLS